MIINETEVADALLEIKEILASTEIRPTIFDPEQDDLIWSKSLPFFPIPFFNESRGIKTTSILKRKPKTLKNVYAARITKGGFPSNIFDFGGHGRIVSEYISYQKGDSIITIQYDDMEEPIRIFKVNKKNGKYTSSIELNEDGEYTFEKYIYSEDIISEALVCGTNHLKPYARKKITYNSKGGIENLYHVFNGEKIYTFKAS